MLTQQAFAPLIDHDFFTQVVQTFFDPARFSKRAGSTNVLTTCFKHIV
jgi:hypothetical protein